MELIKGFINTITAPSILITLFGVGFTASLFVRSFWTTKAIYITMAVIVGFFGLSALDTNFRTVLAKPDNVPIVILIISVAFFIWLSMNQALKYDRAKEKGEKPQVEVEGRDKIFVWPDLVYVEFISMLVMSAFLIVWSILVKAPIEQPANPADSPNPSKAPWYFLGLQEMLVYYDPWLAGVVLPGLIIVGLIAIPYIDKNPKGNGYFTFKERPFAIAMFLFGFVVLWVLLIVMGTFLRGPNWNFFGPYEYWDVHKLEALVNVNVSELFWIKMLRQPLPNSWFIRELPGFVLVIAYLGAMPPLLARLKFFKKMYEEMGHIRYMIMIYLLLIMASLPIKMYLRWLFNLKYIVAIPEFFFNI
jgi:hypothetical protein